MQAPELSTLIGVYYHQDFEGIWGTLDDYLSKSTSPERHALVAQIEFVLQTFSGEAAVEDYLDELGNCADMSGEPGGYRGWLEEIARRVRAHLGD